MMYFVKFRGALRGKFMNWKTADLKLAPFPSSLAATLRGFAFYLALTSARFADVTDEGRKIRTHETRERHERRRKLALKFSHLFACLVGRIVLVLFARSRKHREFPSVRSVPDGTSPLDFARAKLGSALPSVLSVRSAVKLYFGAREATIFSKHGSPRRGSQNGSSFNSP